MQRNAPAAALLGIPADRLVKDGADALAPEALIHAQGVDTAVRMVNNDRVPEEGIYPAVQ